MASRIQALKNRFEKRLQQLHDEFYEAVKMEVIRTCDRRKWNMTSVYLTRLTHRGPEENEVDESDPDSQRLIGLVYWLDGLRIYSDFIYENGVWTP